MNSKQKEKFRELLAGFNTAVLITHSGGKPHFHARPMALAGVDDNCDLWFITSRDSLKVHEIEKDAQVQVVCQNGWTSCLSVVGHAVFNTDAAKLEALWNSSYQVWFPRGINDPQIMLIQVVGEQGEYWDNTGINRFTYLYQAIKAMVTGTTPTVHEGDQHGSVKLS